jgi:hypothetical protein
MANKKISQLTVAAPLTGTELLPIVQGGVTVQATAQNIADLAGGLEGTQYVFVAANGTDVENAAELQAAYEEAITKLEVITNESDLVQDAFLGNPIFMTSSGFQSYNYAAVPPNLISEGIQFVDIVNDGESLTIEIDVLFSGEFQMVFLNLSGLELLNITSFIYSTSTFIPATVIAAPGYYNFEADFQMNTQYVNLVSLDGNRSIIFNGIGTISVTENNVFVKGIDTINKSFIVGTNNLNFLKVENCKGGSRSFGYDIMGGVLSGTFIDCEAENNSFGSYLNASGTFINCVANSESFGSFANASGTFINCKGRNYCFASPGLASGTFTNCESLFASFGSGDNNSGFITVASGVFNNCIATSNSFGCDAYVNGSFINCIAQFNSFGGSSGFGGTPGTADGIFTNCIGGYGSFGGPLGSSGTLSGKLYYCRLTGGQFQEVSGSGITRLCIDGDNNENNQG